MPPEDTTIPAGFCQCGCGTPTKLCRNSVRRLGRVYGKPFRFAPGHNRRQPLTYSVNATSGCWIWDGSLNHDGYGYFVRARRQYFAHRWFYEEARGPIPANLELDHLCRNRACVNPDHLEAVTDTVNCRRGIATKLTEAQVKEIRSLQGVLLQRQIAERFGISQTNVSSILRRVTWTE